MKKTLKLNPIRFAFRRAGAETVYNDLVAPFFKLSSSRAFVAGIIASNLSVVGAGVFMNHLYGRFMDHLGAHNVNGFKADLAAFVVCGLLFAAVNAARSLSGSLMGLSWRNWARTQMVKAFCSADRRGGFVSTSNGERTQTGQRIVEDMGVMVGTSSFLVGGGIQSLADAGAFSVVLWGISPSMWMGLMVTSGVGLIVSRRWAKRLQQVDNEAARCGNDYRNAIVKAATNMEAIEFLRGEQAEIKGLEDKQARFNDSIKRRIFLSAKIDAWKDTVDNIAKTITIAIGGRDVFRSDNPISSGKYLEGIGASRSLTGSLSWFLYAVPSKNYWLATVKRLEAFLAHSKTALPQEQSPAYTESGEAGVHIEQLILAVKDQEPLCAPISLVLKPGDRIALTGDSGCGKTTLLRQLAGVMPIRSGDITYTGLLGADETIFVPQDPYIPDLTLPEVLSYPKPGIVFSKEEMAAALEKVGLGSQCASLDDKEKTGAIYAQELSGGERQRLHFARLILHKFKVIGLDEVTASLPKADGEALYKLLSRECPNSIIISTIHRRELVRFHVLRGHFEKGRLSVTPVGQNEVKPSAHRPCTAGRVRRQRAARLHRTY